MSLTYTPRTGVSLLHEDDLDQTMRCVRMLELGSDLDLDLVVVTRAEGAADREALVAGLRDRGRVVPASTASADEAHNVALAGFVDQGSSYAWVLRPNLAIAEWLLGFLVRHLEKTPDCAVVGNRVTLGDGTDAPIWSDGGSVTSAGEVVRLSAGLRRGRAPKREPAEVDAVYRPGSLYRVSTLETVGLFAAGDTVDGHDVGWCARARAAGWHTDVHRRARIGLERSDD